MNNIELQQSVNALNKRLDVMADQLALIRKALSPESYPPTWSPLEKAFSYLPFESEESLKAACANGFFKAGTELKNIGLSPDVGTPNYRINLRAYLERS